MVLSHVQLSAAAGYEEPSASPAESAENEADGTQSLEMEPMDPAKLGIKKLGEETEEEGSEGEDGEISLTPDTSLNQTVRVSIFLSGKSTVDAGYSTMGIAENKSAAAYRDTLKAQQKALTAKIESVLGHTLDVKWNLTLLANAISANVKVKEIPLIERLDGVRKVERERYYEAPVTGGGQANDPMTANTSENMVGAANAWYQLGYTGAGSRIAIIDTGLDTEHQSVNNDAFLHAIEEVRADGKTVDLTLNIPSGLNGAGVKISDKIPYAYNYIDHNTTNVAHQDSARNHGSHVAGIAAANRYIKNGSGYVDAAEEVGAVGMAPDAQILVMKVFGAGGGAYDSDYFAALEDAIVLGADAANLSLGSASPGWTYDTEYQDALNAFVNNENNHMVVSISAGNSDAYDDHTSHALYAEDAYFHTGGSPGSYINSLGVASANNTLTEGTPLMFDGDLQVFYAESTEDSDGNAYTNAAMTTVAGTWNYVYIDALGAPEDYAAVNSAVSLSGKIVIVNRGELSFVQKGENAKSYNPKALIVANKQDGVIHMDLTDFTGTFPYVTITLKDANRIKEGKTAQTANGVSYYTGSVEVTTTKVSTVSPREEAEVSSFSSWGVPGSLIMKPEIVAPGGDINSIYGTSNADEGSSTTTYETFSGTSMAAPHIAGLSAVLMQYLKEKTPTNDDLMNGYTLRAIAQSLLMSTATPMINGNAYVSILQQGSGLAEVSKAIEAKSVIMMDEAYLTTDTGAAADGKVKVELGDDPARKGEYTYTFTIYNISDETLKFELDTDLFTQAIDGDTLSHKTALLPYEGVTYEWNGNAPADAGHDVNKDGTTGSDDAQTILDYLSGKFEEEGGNPDDLDLDTADMDGDGAITSRDAYLLLEWEPEEAPEGYIVAPHDKAQVTVHINLTGAQKAALGKEGGAYLEGYTYVDCVTSTDEGLALDHEHTIPILGYFGSWTDPSMFDTNSYTENLYGNEQLPYSGANAAATNYMRYTTNGTLAKFSGNPYMVEDEFPEDRLAIRSDAKINDIAYNLIRSAAGTGFAISKLDDDGNVANIITASVNGQAVYGVYGAWYHVNNAAWQNTATKNYNVGKALNEYNGLADGDRVRVGFYAIPEYNTMLESEDLTTWEAGILTESMFRSILTSNVLGKGAFVGFDLTIDDVEPEIVGTPTLTGNTLSVTASDDKNLAYIGILSLDGSVKYKEVAPGAPTATVSLDATNAIANAQGYVAVFVADYAGNEAAYAVKVNDNNHVEKTVYQLTNTVNAGDEYLIMNTNSAGSGYALYYTLNTSGTTATAGAVATDIQAGIADTDGKPYIESANAASTAVWTAGTGNTNGTYTFNNNGWFLRRSNSNALTITKDTSRRDWTWNGTNNLLSINNRYLRYYNNTFSLNTATNSVYLYVKTTISYEIDPYSVMSVTVTPNTLDLYRGDTANLTAKVVPMTATDRSVTWSSDNPSVATVNDVGEVTAVAAGTTTIRATSTADPTKFGECVVTVTAINKELSAAIWDEEGEVYFSKFNANSLPTWTKSHNTPTGVYVTSAMMASSSDLYACTNDLSTSLMYTVNRSSYAMTETGECYVIPFGMATVGTSFGGTDYFVTAFAKYIMFGNLQPEEDEEYGTYIGFPYGLLDLSETDVGDAYAVAICCRNKSTTSAGYYFLDENGKIWQTNQSYSSSAGITFSNPTVVYDTGINAGLQYNSIYYDGTNLYWTHQEDNDAVLYILANANDSSNRKFYRAGTFGEGVWPAAGLYVNGSLAPASVGDNSEIMEAGNETFDASTLKVLATRDELFTADIQARFAAEAERMATKQVNTPAEEPAQTEAETPAETAEAEDPAETPAETESAEAPAETEAPETPVEVTEAADETPAEPEETEAEPAETEAPEDPSEEAPETESKEAETPEEVTDAPAETEEEAKAEEPAEDAEEPAEPETEVAEPAAEAEPAEAEETTEEVFIDPAYSGSLNLARVVSAPKEQISDAPAQKAATPSGTDADGTYTVAIYEEVAVNNGLYAFSYNPNELEFVKVQTDLTYNSINVDEDTDEEKGVIWFAFASSEAVAVNDNIAVFTFKVKSSEEGMTLEVDTLERNEDVELAESEVLEVPPLSVASPSFQKHSLVLSGQIGVNFFLDLPEIEGVDYSNSYVEFTISGKDGATTIDTYDPNFKNATGQYFGFTCFVNSIQMAETITAVFHYGNEETVTDEYSVKQYIESFESHIDQHTAKEIAIVQSMADYGHYVQPFLSEARGWVLDVDYKTMDKYYTESYNIDNVIAAVADYAIQRDHNDEDIESINFTLSLDSGTDIFVYFKPMAGYTGKNFTFTLNGQAVTAQMEAGRYKVVIKGISAHELGDTFTIVAETENGDATVKVSALSYVQSRLGNPNCTEAGKNAVASIYYYYKTAHDYKN